MSTQIHCAVCGAPSSGARLDLLRLPGLECSASWVCSGCGAAATAVVEPVDGPGMGVLVVRSISRPEEGVPWLSGEQFLDDLFGRR